MEIEFEPRIADRGELHETAMRRVRFTMRRVQWLVSRVRVRLTDSSGTRGGVDKCCDVHLEIAGAPAVVIRSLARDSRTALEVALRRAARCVLRTSGSASPQGIGGIGRTAPRGAIAALDSQGGTAAAPAPRLAPPAAESTARRTPGQ